MEICSENFTMGNLRGFCFLFDIE